MRLPEASLWRYFLKIFWIKSVKLGVERLAPLPTVFTKRWDFSDMNLQLQKHTCKWHTNDTISVLADLITAVPKRIELWGSKNCPWLLSDHRRVSRECCYSFLLLSQMRQTKSTTCSAFGYWCLISVLLRLELLPYLTVSRTDALALPPKSHWLGLSFPQRRLLLVQECRAESHDSIVLCGCRWVPVSGVTGQGPEASPDICLCGAPPGLVFSI